MSDILSLFPVRIRIASDDGTMTPEFFRAINSLMRRVGGDDGDGGIDVLAPFGDGSLDGSIGPDAQSFSDEPDAACDLVLQAPEPDYPQMEIYQSPDYLSDYLPVQDSIGVGAANFESLTTSLGFGCNGMPAQAAYSVGAESTDLDSVIVLTNNMRLALIANGIAI